VDHQLVEAVAASRSISEVARRLGYKVSGGVHRWLKVAIRVRRLDTSHFLGQAWARGTFGCRPQRSLEDILTANSTFPASRLRQRLISEGLKPAHCENCGIDEWMSQPLPLHLDHVNGDHMDNRIENLRILCPNCHAPTTTWCRQRSAPA
jgi:hypothetical protein